MRHRHGRHCGCHACKTLVHPTKHNCVNQFSESTVNHVHPSHTTVMNHHLQKNKHFFPHSTSVQNTFNSVDEYGGSFEVPSAPNQVAGAFSPPGGPGQVMGATQPGYGMGQGPGQVMGATQPGYGMGQGPGQVMGASQPGCGMGPGQVMGATQPGYGMQPGKHWNKPGKWC